MIGMILLTTMLFYDPGVNITPYLEVLPAECSVRIDIVNRTNIHYAGYAWYSGRIIIYDGNDMSDEIKKYVLSHEIGHVCSKNNRAGSYDNRELTADNFVFQRKVAK